MTKSFWLKGALLLASGITLGIGSVADGCLGAAIQRILVAVNFD